MIDIQKLFTENKDVHLPPGRYTTFKDIVIPEGGSLTGEPGAIITFLDGRKNICMSRPNVRLQGVRVDVGGVLITTSHTVCKDVVVSANGSIANNLGGAFKVHVATNQCLEDHVFENCTAIDCGRHGFLNEGDHQGANKVIRNQKYLNCKAIRCGAKSRVTDYYTGFDLNECPTNILKVYDILLSGCHAEGCLESGFHLEQAPIVENVKFVNCTSSKNGLIKRGVPWEYGSGFYIRNGVTLENCKATGNHFGIFVAVGKGNPSEPAIIKGCTTTGNAANKWIKGGKDLQIQNGCINVSVDSILPKPEPVPGKIDLLPYFIPSPENADKGLYLRADMEYAEQWGRPKSKTVALRHDNGDVSFFEIADTLTGAYVYSRYVKKDEEIYDCLNCADFSANNKIWVSSGGSMCRWMPRYCNVGYHEVVKDMNMYEYTPDGKYVGESGFWPMTMDLVSCGPMDVGGDLGVQSVAVVKFQPNPPYGYMEFNYMVKGWGRVAWGLFKNDGTPVIDTVWWTRVMKSDLLPKLEISPKPYCDLPTVAIGGQKVPKDKRCK